MHQMKIGVSGYVGPAHMGIARTLKNVLRRLKGLATHDVYQVYINYDNDDFDDIVDSETIRKTTIGTSRFRPLLNLIWHQLLFQYHLARNRADIAFIANVTLLLWKVRPTVVVIHDLIEFNVPGKFSGLRMIYRKVAVPLTARRADGIITVSQKSKDDIVRYCRVPPSKVRVVYNGVDDAFRVLPAEETARRLARYGVDHPYIMYVGTIDHPGKNSLSLIRAFHEIKSRHSDYQLILIGKPGHGFEHITSEVERLGLRSDVVMPGFVADEALVAFYNGATALTLLSLYEGFGLPLVEAMACGTPVLAANTSCLPEIVGEAGVLVEPLDTAQIAEQLERLISDEGLRASLRTRGLERAKLFSWERSAGQVSDYLHEIMAQRQLLP